MSPKPRASLVACHGEQFLAQRRLPDPRFASDQDNGTDAPRGAPESRMNTSPHIIATKEPPRRRSAPSHLFSVHPTSAAKAPGATLGRPVDTTSELPPLAATGWP